MGTTMEPAPPKAAGTDWFEAAVRDCYPLVFAIAYQKLSRVEDAEDAAQEVFLRAFRFQGGLRDRDRVAGWLARIAYNVSNDTGRRRARQELPPLPSQLPAPPKRPRWTDEQEAVQRAIGRLKEAEALVINLRFSQGLSPTQIAEQLQERPGTIRVRLHRALKHLRRCLVREA